MNSDTIPNLKKKVASKRIFQFLSKHPTETKAKNFFSKVKQSNKTLLTTIFEDTTVTELPEKIPDSPGGPSENYTNSSGASPFNSSFSNHKIPQDLLGSSPTTSLLVRSGSLSPRSFIPGRKLEENNYKAKFHLPMTGTQALLLYPDYLSELEKKEIVRYEQIYFFGHKIEKLTQNLTDENGVYKVVTGDHLGYRYEIIELLGKGTFGHVYKCFDYKRDILVAVKILRKSPKIRRQGENEIKNLEMINEQDPYDNKCLVRMLQCFEFRGHLFISFELLSINLYQFLKKVNFKGINLNLIKRIALQVLIGLRHLHGMGLTHSDLKLENILLKNEGKSSIKVIDLGSAIHYINPLCSYLQSRYYRSPEVILGAGFDNKIDIWSLGCILTELFTGRALFPGENEHDQLIRIMSVIGLPSKSILDRSKRWSMFFNQDLSPKLVKNKRGVILHPATKDLFSPSDKDEIVFKDFLKLCLKWDSNLRPSAEEALKHPWIKGNSTKEAKSMF
jgi:dual specificity tyrosine-phosphorylation-regulated kinase 2/3/4